MNELVKMIIGVSAIVSMIFLLMYGLFYLRDFHSPIPGKCTNICDSHHWNYDRFERSGYAGSSIICYCLDNNNAIYTFNIGG